MRNVLLGPGNVAVWSWHPEPLSRLGDRRVVGGEVVAVEAEGVDSSGWVLATIFPASEYFEVQVRLIPGWTSDSSNQVRIFAVPQS